MLSNYRGNHQVRKAAESNFSSQGMHGRRLKRKMRPKSGEANAECMHEHTFAAVSDSDASSAGPLADAAGGGASPPPSSFSCTVSHAQGESNPCDSCSRSRQMDEIVGEPASCLRRSNHSAMAPLTAMVRWPWMKLRRPQTTAQAPTRMRRSLQVPRPPPRRLS